jgi:hypothetical protein
MRRRRMRTVMRIRKLPMKVMIDEVEKINGEF